MDFLFERHARQQIGDALETILMPRYQEQQCVGTMGLQQHLSVEHLFFFSGVRAAGNPHASRGAECRAQIAPQQGGGRIGLQIEFHVADDACAGRIRAD